MRHLVIYLCWVGVFCFTGCSDNNQRLLEASASGNLDMVKSLIKAGAQIDCASKGGRHFTPLLWSIYEKNYDVSEYLLNHGANPNLTDIEGKSALFYALGETDQDAHVFDLLLKAGGKAINIDSEMEFFAARNEKLKGIIERLRKK